MFGKTLVGIAVLSLCTCLGLGHGMAQGKKINGKQIVGSWILASISNTSPDGKTIQAFSAGDGMVVFAANGTFVQALIRSDIPKFSANNRNSGTPDENKAVVQHSLTFIGTYKISDDGTLTLHVDRSTFPNWNGTDQKRDITSLTASELKWHNPLATVGGTIETSWKRNK